MSFQKRVVVDVSKQTTEELELTPAELIQRQSEVDVALAHQIVEQQKEAAKEADIAPLRAVPALLSDIAKDQDALRDTAALKLLDVAVVVSHLLERQALVVKALGRKVE